MDSTSQIDTFCNEMASLGGETLYQLPDKKTTKIAFRDHDWIQEQLSDRVLDDLNLNRKRVDQVIKRQFAKFLSKKIAGKTLTAHDMLHHINETCKNREGHQYYYDKEKQNEMDTKSAIFFINMQLLKLHAAIGLSTILRKVENLSDV